MKTSFQPDGPAPGDFREIFASCASEFHWLCFSLTGDEQRARASIAAALDESAGAGGLVFHEWMTKWARRQLLKSCIAAMRAEIGAAARHFATLDRLQLNTSFAGDLHFLVPATLQRLLLQLDVVSRFVFVLQVLEAYSRRETALLLDISDAACVLAYARACSVMHSAIEDSGAMMPGATTPGPCSPAGVWELQVR